MNCATYEPDLGDYIDGVDATSTLDAHLAGCGRCRSLAADLRAIRTTARTLEPQAPSPRVWTGVAASLRQSSHRGPLPHLWAYVTARPLVAAAAVLLALVIWIGVRTYPGAGAGEAGAVRAEALAVEAQYAEIQRLEQIAREAAQLDPETAEVFSPSLAVVEQAVDESRAAVDAEPGSELAVESLFDALRTKMQVLQDMVVLINEMRRGNQEEAARIASDVEQ